ncbi:MAG TPA: sigma 54-interacting transcriptional regulator [Labilithrix sp.]|jgi:Nif-specific regulatory protein|nr:sigma 54-interacting transcriptional regulator [Labilithrix sp.]
MDVASLTAERDLYRKLLDLGVSDEVETFLREALALSMQASSACRGYIEIRDEAETESGPWWIAEGFSDAGVEATRAAISSGVIAEALATGRTIVTASALDDPRFSSRESVKSNRIEAVLCAPIGHDPVFGVLYLQDRVEAGPFTEEDRMRAERLSRHLAPLADRLLLRTRARSASDAIRPFRASLSLGTFAGRSPAMARVLRDIAAAAPRKVTILLTGPSGTGKTQLARIIHENSPRKDAPFVELNCATLPEPLVESELFGAMPGSHSTATRRIQGKVEAAEGGTLFLDEIADLPLAAQSKLLQLLQSLEYFPLGATKPLRADVRIIVATNADLEAAVERRMFREDLLYRIQIVPIHVPPLAARPEDIRELVPLFCERACSAHGVPPLAISPRALRAAEASVWPGNVRQLENAVEAAVIRAAAENAARLETHHLFVEHGAASDNVSETFQSATRRFQGEMVLRTLEDTDWNIVEAARRLDVTRSHVYNLIRAHGLERAARRTGPR